MTAVIRLIEHYAPAVLHRLGEAASAVWGALSSSLVQAVATWWVGQ